MRDTAYYYPAPYWRAREGDWIKSLLLFFDKVAILLPDYMWGRHTDADPTLAGPLEERGLLRVLEPNEWFDAEVLDKLADIMVELLAGGVFNGLPGGGSLQAPDTAPELYGGFRKRPRCCKAVGYGEDGWIRR